MIRDQFFDDVQYEEREFQGKIFRFPAAYKDYRCIFASFPASRVRVMELLPSIKMVPMEISPGATVIGFTGYEYLEIDGLEPYNEFSVTIPVNYELDSGEALPGIYAVYKPVTTDEAADWGNEFFGYPRTISDIRFNEDDDVLRCQVENEGQQIISLEVGKRPTTLDVSEGYIFMVKEGELIRSFLQNRGRKGTSASPDAHFILGDHPIAKDIMTIAPIEQPLSSTYSIKMKMKFHKPSEQYPL